MMIPGKNKCDKEIESRFAYSETGIKIYSLLLTDRGGQNAQNK